MYWKRNHTIIRAAFVCLFVCLFVPYVLRGPLTDLRQTWWVYVGWPPICPWGVLFRKGQRVDGSTGHFRFPLCYICGRLTPYHCKKHSAYDSRQHQTHATPLTKAHGIFCSLETGNFLVIQKIARAVGMYIFVQWIITLKVNSYSASHDNRCTVGGDGDVGSARCELALLPLCPTIRVVSYSN